MEQGWQDEYLANLKAIYGRRVEAMNAALRQYLGDSVHFTKPAGGFFFWLELPAGINTQLLLETARDNLVGFQPGVKFSSSQGLHNCMRLSFAYYDERDIERGIERLANVINREVAKL